MAQMDLGSRIMKVDHAGEFGAICIYTGQIWLASLRARDLIPEFIELDRMSVAIAQSLVRSWSVRSMLRWHGWWVIAHSIHAVVAHDL
jgi:demethoxyubiquinone hydroxylase (CLK1/Coq7/Cat5 family)